MPGSGAAPRCRGNRCHVPAVPRLGLRRDLPDGLLTAGQVSPDTPSQARPTPQIGQRPGQIRRSGGGVDRRLPHPPRHPPSRKAWSFLIDFRGGHRNLGFHDGLGDLREQPFDRALRRGDRGLARDHPCHARDCPACAGVDRCPMRAAPADPPGDRRSGTFASTSAPGRLRVPDTRSVGPGFRTTRGSPPGFRGPPLNAGARTVPSAAIGRTSGSSLPLRAPTTSAPADTIRTGRLSRRASVRAEHRRRDGDAVWQGRCGWFPGRLPETSGDHHAGRERRGRLDGPRLRRQRLRPAPLRRS